MAEASHRSYFKLLEEFNNLGCKNKAKCAIACQVYHNLMLSQRNTDLERIYIADLDIIYLRCKKRGKPHVFYPLITTQKLDFSKLDAFHKHLKTIGDESEVCLGICDSSSNVLYYSAVEGLTTEFIPTSKKKRRMENQERKHKEKKQKLTEQDGDEDSDDDDSEDDIEDETIAEAEVNPIQGLE